MCAIIFLLCREVFFFLATEFKDISLSSKRFSKMGVSTTKPRGPTSHHRKYPPPCKVTNTYCY